MDNLLDLTYEEVEKLVLDMGEKKFRASQLFSALYNYKNPNEITNLSKDFLSKLQEQYVFNPLTIYQKYVGKDGTIKYLYKLNDGNIIEGVLMSYKYGNTLCVSTQVGCRMGCKFCASTLGGLIKNLSSGEILAQVLCVNRDIGGTMTDRKITNIVLMGSGEPLDNYDNVLDFIRIMNHPKGLAIGARHISVSTCGLVAGIMKYAHEGLQTNLAISLHAPNDEIRNKLMPINLRYPLDDIIPAIIYFQKETGRVVTFEYILIKDVNDSIDCAKELVSICKKTKSYVNLIPYNQVIENGLTRSSNLKVNAFHKYLLSNHIKSTIRKEFGSDINAACGQLRVKKDKEKS